MNKIYLKDCIQGMQELDDNIAQCIIVDPPYNIGKNFGNNKMKLQRDEYIKFCSQWIKECVRILKPNGTMFIYGFSEILMHVGVFIEENYPSLHIRWLVWSYTNKVVPKLNGWQRTHESILCCTFNNEKPIFHRDEVRIPYTKSFLKNAAGKERKGTIGRFNKNGQSTIYKAHEKGALPRDVIQCPALAGGAGKKERCGDVKHPTQKPETLTDILLKSCKQDKGIVVVPFAGSGTECVVAKQNNIPFIGFELNQKYIEIAQIRLEKLI